MREPASKRRGFEMIQALLRESKGQNLDLTVSYVPYSLDSGGLVRVVLRKTVCERGCMERVLTGDSPLLSPTIQRATEGMSGPFYKVPEVRYLVRRNPPLSPGPNKAPLEECMASCRPHQRTGWWGKQSDPSNALITEGLDCLNQEGPPLSPDSNKPNHTAGFKGIS